MIIDADTVKKIASLARIKVSAEDSSALAKDLQSIVSYVDSLAEADADGEEPAALAPVRLDDLRTDSPVLEGDRELLLPKERFGEDGLLNVSTVFHERE